MGQSRGFFLFLCYPFISATFFKEMEEKSREYVEGEDTQLHFLTIRPPLLFRCSRQVPLMSADFGEVGGRGFMRVT